MLHDDAYHWPPELLELLIETVPRLSRSKEGVLTFLRSAGVSEDLLAPYRRQLADDRASVGKFKIARAVLGHLNEQGDRALGVRRELLRRVTDFQEFSTLWQEDQLKAKGLIADVRNVVNVKDSFTRMRMERDEERSGRIAEKRAEQAKAAARRLELNTLRDQLASVFSMTDPHARGTALETALNAIFAFEGILIREPFAMRNDDGQSVEQIDGVIELDAIQYIVEMKFWNKPIGVDPVCRQLVRVFSRAEVRGLFISASGYTSAAVEECTRALTNRVVVLGELRELVYLLEQAGNTASWLREKVRLAAIERRPLTIFGIDFT
ncbi:restriction endonuclease [Streptomyces sp. NPDC058279]|uniref:restriction endonuclease n=1 Tax=Streptomyces sp. NPDC058279 TaxID=3346418 RepID=UPI0036EEC5FE